MCYVCITPSFRLRADLHTIAPDHARFAQADEKKAEQERMRNFTIEGADSLKTMRTVESPAPPTEEQ